MEFGVHRFLHPSASFSAKPRARTTHFSASNDNLDQPQQQRVSTITYDSNPFTVNFKTLRNCKLGISRFPDFVYNADGGTGTGNGVKILDNDGFNGEVNVDFDVDRLYIPAISTATTKFLGLPLPPFLKIDIVPEVFDGIVNQESGKVDLKFKAEFRFSVGSIYRAPPLVVETVLTSEKSMGKIKKGRGERLDKDGICRLVGVAIVQPMNELFMDSFLSLPTECLADLNAIITFESSE